MGRKRKWRESNIMEVVRFSATRTIDEANQLKCSDMPESIWSSEALGILFTDGTAVACKSEYEGDYSELTPGAGVQPPTFWISE